VLAGRNPDESRGDVAAQINDRDRHAAPSIYMHVPFCVHKCHYCDFYSIVDNRHREEAFTHRLVREIEASQPFFSVPIRTIFVGGGTPTLLEPALWNTLGKAIRHHMMMAPSCEFTVEANPETVTPELVNELVAAGVNRISVGAQSFHPQHLKMLERQHDPRNVEKSVQLVRAAGISNINIDLIFGIPGQSLADWQDDLRRVLEIGPTHMSCYGLTYEPNTAMTARLHAGRFERIEESLEAEMYEFAIDALASAGFEHYEISNWSLPGRRCQHNLAYWRNENWWALGPSASGHVNGLRWKNVPRLADYLETDSPSGFPPITDVERVDDDARKGEALMLHLRLLDGVPRNVLSELMNDARRHALDRHIAAGLIEQCDQSVRFTRRGLLLADTVLADLI
jgi:oxygen-independent coproporphyrinogen-3 oxidase